jgi:hypothetical protein
MQWDEEDDREDKGVWDYDWLNQAMNNPIPPELAAALYTHPHRPITTNKDNRFSKTMGQVWVNAVKFLLEFAFKQNQPNLYYKTVQKM